MFKIIEYYRDNKEAIKTKIEAELVELDNLLGQYNFNTKLQEIVDQINICRKNPKYEGGDYRIFQPNGVLTWFSVNQNYTACPNIQSLVRTRQLDSKKPTYFEAEIFFANYDMKRLLNGLGLEEFTLDLARELVATFRIYYKEHKVHKS